MIKMQETCVDLTMISPYHYMLCRNKASTGGKHALKTKPESP